MDTGQRQKGWCYWQHDRTHTIVKLGAELVGAGCIVAMASTPWRMDTLLLLVLSCASLAAARESHLTTKGKKKQISLIYSWVQNWEWFHFSSTNNVKYGIIFLSAPWLPCHHLDQRIGGKISLNSMSVVRNVFKCDPKSIILGKCFLNSWEISF